MFLTATVSDNVSRSIRRSSVGGRRSPSFGNNPAEGRHSHRRSRSAAAGTSRPLDHTAAHGFPGARRNHHGQWRTISTFVDPAENVVTLQAKHVDLIAARRGDTTIAGATSQVYDGVVNGTVMEPTVKPEVYLGQTYYPFNLSNLNIDPAIRTTTAPAATSIDSSGGSHERVAGAGRANEHPRLRGTPRPGLATTWLSEARTPRPGPYWTR